MSLIDDARLNERILNDIEMRIAKMQRLLELHEETLEKLTGFMSENMPTLREIIEVVSEFYLITPREVKGERHIHDHCHPRLIVYYLARKLTRLSLTNIGDRLGERDHTTVRSGFLRIARRIRRDEVLRDDIDVLRIRIAEKVAARELSTLNNRLLEIGQRQP